MSEVLKKELNDGVLVLTFNRPEKKNAFNGEAWETFAAALDEARENDEVVVVVLAGEGKDFSAGQDLSDFNMGADGEAPYRLAEKALCGFDKPLIGAAKGISVGGGATILFPCDIVYVGESLRFRLPFPSLGLVPEFASSYLLAANIGAQKAADILFSAAWLSADEVVDYGMAVAKVSDDKLLETALAKAQEIAQWPVDSLRETKRCLLKAKQAGVEAALKIEGEAMARQMGSAENMEAMMAFIEKRKPNFRDL